MNDNDQEWLQITKGVAEDVHAIRQSMERIAAALESDRGVQQLHATGNMLRNMAKAMDPNVKERIETQAQSTPANPATDS